MTDAPLYLKNNGPTLSGELIRLIRNEEGISDVAIRQRLSRQIDPIRSLKGMLAENQTLFYLKEQYRQPEYYEGILKALSIAAKRHYAVITALHYHQGFTPAEYIASYTFSTVENLHGHKRMGHSAYINPDRVKLESCPIAVTERTPALRVIWLLQ